MFPNIAVLLLLVATTRLSYATASSGIEGTDEEESTGYVIQMMLEAIKKNPQLLVAIKDSLSDKTNGLTSQIAGQNMNPNSKLSGPGNPNQQSTVPYVYPNQQPTGPYYGYPNQQATGPYGYPMQQSIPPYPLPAPYAMYSQPSLPHRETFEETLQDYPLLELFNNLHKKKNDVLIKLKQGIFQHPSYRRE